MHSGGSAGDAQQLVPSFASLGGAQSAGAYFISGYALAMAPNAVVPHVVATVALRVYASGTATALLFNLPLGGWLVYRSLVEGYVDPRAFAFESVQRDVRTRARVSAIVEHRIGVVECNPRT